MKTERIRILMVCLGNICRSPLAEGILRSKVNENFVLVDSAGTAGYHVGNPPDERSVLVARKNGIDISNQRCRKFSHEDFENYDIIYAMDLANLHYLLNKALSPHHKKKVKLLLEETSSGTDEVPDPYYGGKQGFEHVFELISGACDAISLKLDLKRGIDEQN